MFHNALLVAVEGVDGAGKNTLTRKVSALLESSGKHVSHIAFPRYGNYMQILPQRLSTEKWEI